MKLLRAAETEDSATSAEAEQKKKISHAHTELRPTFSQQISTFLYDPDDLRQLDLHTWMVGGWGMGSGG